MDNFLGDLYFRNSESVDLFPGRVGEVVLVPYSFYSHYHYADLRLYYSNFTQ